MLRELLDSFKGSPIVAASSEGALFEYGSDEEISANLHVLREGTPANTIIAGSLTRADATGQLLNLRAARRCACARWTPSRD